MLIVVNAISDKGSQLPTNEDMVLVGNNCLRNTSKEYEFDLAAYDYPFLIAVADGLGGHRSGEYASEFVLKQMARVVNAIPSKLDFIALKKYFANAALTINDVVLIESNSYPDRLGMASTFSGVLFYGNKVYMLHIGDSRIYHHSKNKLTQLSKDHTLFVQQGHELAKKNVISNAFGKVRNIYLDFEEITTQLKDNDQLLLCTDGLTTELSDTIIEQQLSQPKSHLRLVELANKQSSGDNISLALIRYIKY